MASDDPRSTQLQSPAPVVPPAPASGFGPGTILGGKYRLDARIGEGGMGEVWRGRHLHLDAPVAIKVLTSKLAQQERAIERLRREARMTGNLGHPNIVRVVDVSAPHETTPYIVMELLDGESLRSFMDRHGPLPAAQAAFILDSMLSGLLAAHRQNIVHRDVKPENVMIVTRDDPDADGHEFGVKMLDFGASKQMEDAPAHLTQAGMLVGTPLYMSPEQASGEDIDARSDLYSAGVVFYEMLSGRVPHSAKNVPALILAISSSDATPITNYIPTLPRHVQVFIRQAMARERSDRFGSADHMRQDLRALMAKEGIAAPGGGGNTSPRPSVQPDAEAIQLAAALDKAVAMGDIADLDQAQAPAPQLPSDPSGPRLPDPRPMSFEAAQAATAAPELSIDLDRRDPEAADPQRKRPKFNYGNAGATFAIAAAAGVLPAYVTWRTAGSATQATLRQELAISSANPVSGYYGTTRRPSEIQADLDAAEGRAMMSGFGAWVVTAALVGAIVAMKRRG